MPISRAGNGLMGLSEMFSLKAVDLGRLVDCCSCPIPSSGSVSDLFIRFLMGLGSFVSAERRRVWEWALDVDGGDGIRVLENRADGSLE